MAWTVAEARAAEVPEGVHLYFRCDHPGVKGAPIPNVMSVDEAERQLGPDALMGCPTCGQSARLVYAQTFHVEVLKR